MAKLFSTVLFLIVALAFLSGCGSGGGMNVAKLPVSDDTVLGITGDITDASVQKEALYLQARVTRDKAYKSMYAQSGFSVEFEMVEVSPGVKVQTMKKVQFREAPRFDQPLPDGPSEHPAWRLANNVVDKGTNAFLWWTGIPEGASLLKDGWSRTAPQYHGDYNPQTAAPYIVSPEIVTIP